MKSIVYLAFMAFALGACNNTATESETGSDSTTINQGSPADNTGSTGMGMDTAMGTDTSMHSNSDTSMGSGTGTSTGTGTGGSGTGTSGGTRGQ